MNKQIMIIFLFPVLSLAACAQNRQTYQSPPGYDLNKPVKYHMPDDLLEISGIAFENDNSSLLYAEQDEEGKVFYLKLGDKKTSTVKFGKHGDYEDIAICNDQVIILRSDGVLFTFPLTEVKGGKINDVKECKDLLPKGEYESLYANQKTDELILLCKDSHKDHKNGNVSGYVLQLEKDGSITSSGEFKFNTTKIVQLSSQKHHVDFKPSALTKNPATGEWYILSSVNKMLMVADKNWKIVQVYHLDPSLFIQPEGITFDDARALYISNEGSKTKAGTVFKFPYHENK